MGLNLLPTWTPWICTNCGTQRTVPFQNRRVLGVTCPRPECPPTSMLPYHSGGKEKWEMTVAKRAGRSEFDILINWHRELLAQMEAERMIHGMTKGEQ